MENVAPDNPTTDSVDETRGGQMEIVFTVVIDGQNNKIELVKMIIR